LDEAQVLDQLRRILLSPDTEQPAVMAFAAGPSGGVVVCLKRHAHLPELSIDFFIDLLSGENPIPASLLSTLFVQCFEDYTLLSRMEIVQDPFKYALASLISDSKVLQSFK
jgi:hypothetical protein